MPPKRKSRRAAFRKKDEIHLDLPVYPGTFVGKDLDDGDKIVLPQSLLNTIIQKHDENLPEPMIFELKNKTNKRITHCGVLEFSSTEDNAYLPAWMIRNLDLKEGGSVSIRLRMNVPKATFVKLQPVSYEFSSLSNPKSTLEYALRKFTAITTGDVIDIQCENTTHTLHVIETQPDIPKKNLTLPNVVCLIDADVNVDFEEPLERAPSVHLNELLWEEECKGHVPAESYEYYSLVIDQLTPVMVRIALNVSDGDADLFVSSSTQTPTVRDHMWESIHSSEDGTVVIDTSDRRITGNKLYVGVYGYKKDASFTLVASYEEVNEGDSMGGGKGSGHTLHADTDRPIDDPTAKQCSNCRKWIPSSQYQMHTLRCARSNWWCELCSSTLRVSDKDSHTHCAICNVVVRPEEMEKHVDLVHKSIQCTMCGISTEASQLQRHMDEDCSQRLVPCQICEVKVAVSDIKEHESYCKSKSIPCDLCGEMVTRKNMSIHKAVEHNINPSKRVDPFDFESELGLGTGSIGDGPENIGAGSHEDADADLQAALMASMGCNNPASAESTFEYQPIQGSSNLHTGFGSGFDRVGVDSEVEEEEEDEEDDEGGMWEDDGWDAEPSGGHVVPAPTERECPYCCTHIDEGLFDMHIQQCYQGIDQMEQKAIEEAISASLNPSSSSTTAATSFHTTRAEETVSFFECPFCTKNIPGPMRNFEKHVERCEATMFGI